MEHTANHDVNGDDNEKNDESHYDSGCCPIQTSVIQPISALKTVGRSLW